MIKRIYLEITLICVFLIIFLFIHSGLLFFNEYRSAHDTFASYSQFYYALNSFLNSSFPLWDPYTHCGQPFYYHFTKILGGELGVLFFSGIASAFNISFLKLYNYHFTLHFLIFALGCFYLAKVVFKRRVISYYVLILAIFSSHYGLILGGDGALLALEFLPWLMALFILLVTGKTHSYRLFSFVLIFLFFILAFDFIIYFYYLFLFCALYCFFFRKQLSLPKIHRIAWFLAILIFCLGIVRDFVLFSEINNIFPSLRVFISSSKIGSGINIATPLDQVYPVRFRDYLTVLNPLIGRYGGTENKFYLGFIPVFFVFYAIVSRRNKFIWTLAIPGILSLWISLGHKAYLSSLCFYVLPFFKIIRQISLFSLAPVFISFLFISAFGFEFILEKVEYLQDLRKFWKHIQKYLWFFIIVGLTITIAYIPCHKGIIKSLLVLSYYVIPTIGITLCYFINKKLEKFQKKDVIRITLLLGAILFLLLALAIFSRSFFTERLTYFKMNRLIPVTTAFFIIIGYILFSHNKKYSTIVTVFCLGITFMDLIFFTGLTTFTRGTEQGNLVVPERVKPFEYQEVRMKSFWPSNLERVYSLRPAMLYLQSSIITEEKFYSHGILIFTKNRECDFYMLRKFWDAYKRFPERIKRVVMGVDMPKLVFFIDYKVMDDEAVFKECENLNPELLKRFVYLAPDNYEVPPLNKISLEQIPSANIEVEHFDNNRLKLSIDAKENGLLYYSDGYDKNWRCYIDGKQQPIRRANIAFKAVFVPEGRHSVLFIYRPILYLASFWSFLAACIIGFISAYWSWAKKL